MSARRLEPTPTEIARVVGELSFTDFLTVRTVAAATGIEKKIVKRVLEDCVTNGTVERRKSSYRIL